MVFKGFCLQTTTAGRSIGCFWVATLYHATGKVSYYKSLDKRDHVGVFLCDDPLLSTGKVSH